MARLPAEPSPEAKRRMTIIKWCEGHDRKVRLTAPHFGFSPDTISRWVNGYAQYGPSGLENGSRRPRMVRQPQTPPGYSSEFWSCERRTRAGVVRSCGCCS